MTPSQSTSSQTFGLPATVVTRDQSLTATQTEALPKVLSSSDYSQYLHLRIYRDWSDLQELEPLWNHLVSTYPPASIFCTWEWLASWWRNFGKNRELFVLALFDSARLV